MTNFTKRINNVLGPGFLIAATGVGAGDMIAATVAGARFGHVVLWACIVGAVFKYVLNEGVARWQLATKTTLLEGWVKRFHSLISIYFTVYLFIWSFIVAGALMAACGLVAHTIFPQLSIESWGIIHSILAVLLVLIGKYRFLENIMKVFIVLMFSTVIINLFIIDVEWGAILKSAVLPRIPEGSIELILGVIGGVGGSVTMLCYNYWIREKGWNEIGGISKIKIDLKIAYMLTGLFGVAIIVLASSVNPEVVSGSKIILGLADKLAETVGTSGKWIFMVGFWGAVFSSMLGVWNGIPYIFNDLVVSYRNRKGITKNAEVNTKSNYYRLFLCYLAFPPMLLLFLDKPVWIIVLYSIVGAFFMPFLASLLLIMNTKISWVKNYRNKWYTNVLLSLSILLFLYLLIQEILKI
ncbi:hypothetical protein GWK08_09640 [Leptobacterium flavescens]|uniref:Iron transporter n=1 Tax=Leptobacterium flavescens TaxID=472055 RepID=A0A6P0UML6_9FLAO|nr:Nramp family divalent metal transporter [Leptobacterium flavescens]NER13700.1 hypothetical protein [Leptobacterium flavescens]